MAGLQAFNRLGNDVRLLRDENRKRMLPPSRGHYHFVAIDIIVALVVWLGRIPSIAYLDRAFNEIESGEPISTESGPIAASARTPTRTEVEISEKDVNADEEEGEDNHINTENVEQDHDTQTHYGATTTTSSV
ncbi:unnamed protein product [Amoebophrya sp. A25]|nr:unnamed protein product [Amoebophrya sp. A25]|eukprot:GSA25T00012236001.1